MTVDVKKSLLDMPGKSRETHRNFGKMGKMQLSVAEASSFCWLQFGYNWYMMDGKKEKNGTCQEENL